MKRILLLLFSAVLLAGVSSGCRSRRPERPAPGSERLPPAPKPEIPPRKAPAARRPAPRPVDPEQRNRRLEGDVALPFQRSKLPPCKYDTDPGYSQIERDEISRVRRENRSDLRSRRSWVFGGFAPER